MSSAQLPATAADRAQFRHAYIYNDAFRTQVVQMCTRFPWLLQDSPMVPHNLAWFASLPIAEYMQDMQDMSGSVARLTGVERDEITVLNAIRDRLPEHPIASAAQLQDLQRLVGEQMPGVNVRTLVGMLPSILALLIAGWRKAPTAPPRQTAYYSGNLLPDSIKAYKNWGRFDVLSNRWYFSGLPSDTLQFIQAVEARRH